MLRSGVIRISISALEEINVGKYDPVMVFLTFKFDMLKSLPIMMRNIWDVSHFCVWVSYSNLAMNICMFLSMNI